MADVSLPTELYGVIVSKSIPTVVGKLALTARVYQRYSVDKWDERLRQDFPLHHLLIDSEGKSPLARYSRYWISTARLISIIDTKVSGKTVRVTQDLVPGVRFFIGGSLYNTGNINAFGRVDDRAYLLSTSGELYSVSIHSPTLEGMTVTKVWTETFVVKEVACIGGTLFALDIDGDLYCTNKFGRCLIWKLERSNVIGIWEIEIKHAPRLVVVANKEENTNLVRQDQRLVIDMYRKSTISTAISKAGHVKHSTEQSSIILLDREYLTKTPLTQGQRSNLSTIRSRAMIRKLGDFVLGLSIQPHKIQDKNWSVLSLILSQS